MVSLNFAPQLEHHIFRVDRRTQLHIGRILWRNAILVLGDQSRRGDLIYPRGHFRDCRDHGTPNTIGLFQLGHRRCAVSCRMGRVRQRLNDCRILFQGTEIFGITAGETQDPNTSIPRAVRSVFWRILLFYILSMGSSVLSSPSPTHY